MKVLFSLSTSVFAAVVLGGVSGVHAQTQLPPNATVYAAGLNGPRGLAFGPDGLLYVAEAGTGGTAAGPSTCQQVPPSVGPYHGGLTARVSKIDAAGHRVTVASGLPSAVDAQANVIGVAAVAFLSGNLYALTAGGGCSHGNPLTPNAIVRIDRATGRWTPIVDLSAFVRTHPVALPNVDDFEPDGSFYSLLAGKDRLLAVEANHGLVLSTSTSGATEVLLDVSASESHIVPTSLAQLGDNLYLGNLGQFPIEPQQERVLTLSRDLFFFDPAPGIGVGFGAFGQFRIANSKAGFTTVVGLGFGPDRLLYALELSAAAGFPTGGAGRVVRVRHDGTIETVVAGLTVPTAMTFGPDGALYVSNLGAAPAGAGQILRIDVPPAVQ